MQKNRVYEWCHGVPALFEAAEFQLQDATSNACADTSTGERVIVTMVYDRRCRPNSKGILRACSQGREMYYRKR